VSPLAWLELLVLDLDRQAQFYQRLLGFDLVERHSDRIWLGQANRRLLGLVAGARQRSDPAQSGLFHAAWRLPSRPLLGGWLRHALARHIGIDGASDHGVSQAIYLTDPEGNGIEVYWDRPRNEWPYRDGHLAMVTEALNVQELLAQAQEWTGWPEQGDLGHLHMQSHQLEVASSFYEQLGFQVTQTYPGAHFLAKDGYHHHLAVNRWRARIPRDPQRAGLLSYGLRLAERTPALADPLGCHCHCA
jgi:catechol 2,3-dioxygenase